MSFAPPADAWALEDEDQPLATPVSANVPQSPLSPMPLSPSPAPAPAPLPLPLAPGPSPTRGAGALGPLPFMDTERSSTTTRARPIARPEEAGLQAEFAASDARAEARILEEQKIAEEEARIAAGKSDAILAEKESYQKNVEKTVADEQEKDRLAMEQLDKDEAEFRGASFKDFWADKSTGYKVMAGIGLLLGAASGYNGQQNPAIGVIERAVDADFARQKAGMDKLGKNVELSRQKRSDIRETFDRSRMQLEAKKIAAMDSVISRAEAEVARLGPQKVPLQAQAQIEALKEKNLERRQKYFETLRETEQSSTTTKSERPVEGGLDKSVEDGTKDWYDRYSRNPTTLRTTALEDSYASLASAPTDAAGDLSMIFQFMKMLDPAGAVREGEFATAQNATGVPERIRNIYNSLKTGERLDVNQRKEFRGTAKAILDAQRKNQSNFDKGFRKTLPRNVDPERVMVRGVYEDEEKAPTDGKALSPADKAALEWANANPNDARAQQIKKGLGL